MLRMFRKARMWEKRPLGERYDVVVIGAGVHGLATAYYLGQQGVSSVAVLDKGYIGGGATSRSTAIVRANYLTPQAIPFFRESLRLYEGLSSELDFNLMLDQSGRLELAHTDSSVSALRQRAEANRLLDVDSRIVGPEMIERMVPALDMRRGKPMPVMAALYHPPGGVVRHDAVVWAFARGAAKQGAELHPQTEVTGVRRSNGRVTGVETSRGYVAAETVVSATAGWSSTIGAMVDLRLPITTHALQAMVTEPLKPFLNMSLSSANLHAYMYQTDRGEVVIGGAVDPYPTYSMRSTLQLPQQLARHALELLPRLRGARMMRQWAGLCDMSPDYAPIMGTVEGIDGLILSCGWGTWGFKAGPAGGRSIAELIVSGETPALIEHFRLSRFREGRLLNERGAAPAAAIH